MSQSKYPINESFIDALLEKVTKLAQASSTTKKGFMPMNDPMAAAVGAPPMGGPGMPPPGGLPPGPPPGGPGAPPGGPPPLDLSMLLGAPGGIGGPPGPVPPPSPMDVGIGPSTTPPPGGTTPGGSPTGESGAEADASKTIGNMTKDEFSYLLKSSVSNVFDQNVSDITAALRELKSEIADIKSMLSKNLGGGTELSEETESRRML